MECRYVAEGSYWHCSFNAMASPCEVLIDCDDEALARRLGRIAHHETRRIETKYSRYQSESVLSRINRSNGKPVSVDDETAGLLDYAALCWQLSDGKFDITSGVLRKVWRFDGSDRLPSAAAVTSVLEHVGWQKLSWQRPQLLLPAGMELDFGGIGKEYAVDRCAQLCLQEGGGASLLVNYGGDLFASGPRRGDQPWLVSVEDPRSSDGRGAAVLQLRGGGVATSGDARRYLLKDGVRYGHILDPVSGWPVRNGPRSVTVHAQSCVEAGMLATFAMLQGAEAENFLKEEQVKYWCLW